MEKKISRNKLSKEINKIMAARAEIGAARLRILNMLQANGVQEDVFNFIDDILNGSWDNAEEALNAMIEEKIISETDLDNSVPAVLANRIEIVMDNGNKLVAEQSTSPDFSREIYLGIEDKSGTWMQDLAIVMQAYTSKGDAAEYIDNEYIVDVFADPDSEDITDQFNIMGRTEE